MAAVALVLSIVAILISGASAWYTRSQAIATTEATLIARETRRANRSPDLDTKIEDVNRDGGFYRLWLEFSTTETIDDVLVTLPEHSGIRFTPNQLGIRPESGGLVATTYEGEILPGGRVCWRVELNPDEYVEVVRMRVESRRGADTWTKHVSIRAPFTGLPVF